MTSGASPSSRSDMTALSSASTNAPRLPAAAAAAPAAPAARAPRRGRTCWPPPTPLAACSVLPRAALTHARPAGGAGGVCGEAGARVQGRVTRWRRRRCRAARLPATLLADATAPAAADLSAEAAIHGCSLAGFENRWDLGAANLHKNRHAGVPTTQRTSRPAGNWKRLRPRRSQNTSPRNPTLVRQPTAHG